jgi:hypothetical protein
MDLVRYVAWNGGAWKQYSPEYGRRGRTVTSGPRSPDVATSLLAAVPGRV